MEEVLENKSKEPVDIHPLKKGRRILVFIADFFIHYILCFLLFNVLVAPIGKAITSFSTKNSEHIFLTAEMYRHYYRSGVLLSDGSFDSNDTTAGIEFTYRCFLSYYVLDNEESIDSTHPQYGHKLENETIRHFYINIRNNEDVYINHFKHYNETNNYFVFDDVSKSFILKNEVKNELYAYYDPKDAMGETGNTYYNSMMTELFNPLMAEVMSDIETNDLHYEGEQYSFLECKNKILSLEKYHENLMTICTLITHFVSWVGLFLVFPLVRKDRKTLAMLFMKIERVDFYSLNFIKRKSIVFCSFYYLFIIMLGMMFIPSLLVPFNNLFALHILMYCSIFSLALIIASLIFVLLNQYNRTLIDFWSNSLYLSEEDMNELYRARGYNI